MYLEEWLSMARTVVVIDSDVLVKRSKLKFTVLGKEIIQCLGQLRHDLLMALVSEKGRRGDWPPLAGKSTLNRLEHAPTQGPTRYHKIDHDSEALQSLLVKLFLQAHPHPPDEIILDLDATDDPLHGEQEDRFFHGYYRGYCYLPLYIFSGRHLFSALLRPANIDASAGTLEQIQRIVSRLRGVWPQVKILLRADSGFAREELMGWCEQHQVDYLFGLARNSRLQYEKIYCARGEMENRIKEQQIDLFADRTSTHSFRANQLRLFMTSFAYVLVESLRRRALQSTCLPRATVGSIRLKLLKIGAQVTTSVRRIKVAMASGCPYQREFRRAWAHLSP